MICKCWCVGEVVKCVEKGINIELSIVSKEIEDRVVVMDDFTV
jgi:hypothetical protein